MKIKKHTKYGDIFIKQKEIINYELGYSYYQMKFNIVTKYKIEEFIINEKYRLFEDDIIFDDSCDEFVLLKIKEEAIGALLGE